MASPDLAAAIATLLNDDQERILALASSLRAPNRTIESQVRGGSMGACLPHGSRIRIDMSPDATHSVGQVVAFMGGDTVIVHRVVHYGRDHALTRGDARLAPDTPVRRDQILGPVSAVAREGVWRDVPPPAARGTPGRICAAVALGCARILLKLSPGLTGLSMRSLHVVEGWAHRAYGLLASGGR